MPQLRLSPLGASALNPVLTEAYEKIKKHRSSVHWTTQAELLAQIENEGLWKDEDGYKDKAFRVWALDRLGLSPSELTELVKHYHIASECDPANYPKPWDEFTPAIMRQLRRVLPNTNWQTWVSAARGAPSATELERVVDKYLQKEKWVVWKIAMPGEAVEEAEAMLRLALPDVLSTPRPDVERVKDRDVRFRCIQRLAAHAFATYRTEHVTEPPADSVLVPDWVAALIDETLTDAQVAAFLSLPGNVKTFREQLREQIGDE